MKNLTTQHAQRISPSVAFPAAILDESPPCFRPALPLPLFTEPGLAQLSQIRGKIPDDAVMINSNENPLGPCPEAPEAVHSIIAKGGRYLFNLTSDFEELLAEQEGLKRGYVKAYAGSSAPLMQSAIAFTSPDKAFVTGDPGYEAGENSARGMGAPVIRVPLTKTYAHDVRAMVEKGQNAGLFYICNPNNPTGTLTPQEDIRGWWRTSRRIRWS